MKKVSIIIPVYNAEKHIRNCVNSALAQTYKNIEVIIVNDGSSDKSKKIIKSFRDQRIKYIEQENKGVAVTRNNGIRHSTGEFIAFLDADDYYFPKKIEEEVAFLEKHQEFDLVYCNAFHFYDGKPNNLYQHKGKKPSGDVFEELLKGFFGQLNTVLISKKIFNQVGLFDESSCHSEEWDLMLRISRAGFRFGFLDKNLVKIRIDKDSLSRMENQWKMKEHNVNAFNRLFESMTEAEKRKYEYQKILRNLNLKLAIAYLVGGKKKKALSLLKSLNVAMYLVVKFFPIVLLKPIINKFWCLKHRLLLARIEEQRTNNNP